MGGAALRRNFLDNLRFLAVLLLFPYHTFMVYNSFGESFYVKGPEVAVTSGIIAAIWPWLMPLMFMIAGISSYYALQKRTARDYIRERVLRLLIPLLAGIALLVPVQTYIAEVFHNGYSGGYLAQYALFFTKPTDLTGYHGGFTPAHLWFILYLFPISLIALPVMRLMIKSGQNRSRDIPLGLLLLFFLIPSVSQIVLDINGKSFGEYLAFFLLGFIILARDDIQEKLKKHCLFLSGLSLLCMATYAWLGPDISRASAVAYEALYGFYAWVMILAILGLGKRYLDFSNPYTDYLSSASFPVYVFHQQWVVVTAYFALRLSDSILLQMLCIILGSAALTFATYEAFRRMRVTRFLFGIKR